MILSYICSFRCLSNMMYCQFCAWTCPAIQIIIGMKSREKVLWTWIDLFECPTNGLKRVLLVHEMTVVAAPTTQIQDFLNIKSRGGNPPACLVPRSLTPGDKVVVHTLLKHTCITSLIMMVLTLWWLAFRLLWVMKTNNGFQKSFVREVYNKKILVHLKDKLPFSLISLLQFSCQKEHSKSFSMLEF